MQEKNLSINNKTKSALPGVPVDKKRSSALGKDYNLCLVVIGEIRSKKLNFLYRKKNKSTGILSYPLDKKSGEIFITIQVAKRQTKKFQRSFQNLIAFLFIHGLMHLKGMDHGDTMERAEEKLRKQFGI